MIEPKYPRKGKQDLQIGDGDSLQELIDWATKIGADPKEVRLEIEYGWGDDRDELYLMTTLLSDEEKYEKQMKEYNKEMREYNKWKKKKNEEREKREFTRLKKKYDKS